MLAGLLYDDALPFFDGSDHSNGLYPDDVLGVLEDLGISCRSVQRLPRRQAALVAINWRDQDFGGHYVVWDPNRGQFIDPLHGLVGRRELLRACRIEHIWSVGKRNMRQFVKARAARAAAQRMFESLGPAAVGLRREGGDFAIEVRFASEPPEKAWKTKQVKGFPVIIRTPGGEAT